MFDCVAERLLRSVLDLGAFSGKARGGVSVREGQGVVLMCTPPPHSPGKSLNLQLQPEEKKRTFPLFTMFGIIKLITICHYSCDK